MFHTPNDKSYQCADVGKISLSSSMQWNYTKMASHDVANTTANALQVQFDAFRNIGNSIPDKFRVNNYLRKLFSYSENDICFAPHVLSFQIFARLLLGFHRL